MKESYAKVNVPSSDTDIMDKMFYLLNLKMIT